MEFLQTREPGVMFCHKNSIYRRDLFALFILITIPSSLTFKPEVDAKPAGSDQVTCGARGKIGFDGKAGGHQNIVGIASSSYTTNQHSPRQFLTSFIPQGSSHIYFLDTQVYSIPPILYSNQS